jgi:hypothetical protein
LTIDNFAFGMSLQWPGPVEAKECAPWYYYHEKCITMYTGVKKLLHAISMLSLRPDREVKCRLDEANAINSHGILMILVQLTLTTLFRWAGQVPFQNTVVLPRWKGLQFLCDSKATTVYLFFDPIKWSTTNYSLYGYGKPSAYFMSFYISSLWEQISSSAP